MYKHQINEINNDILRTKRAIIGLGCSFVQGIGAINDKIYNNYKWKIDTSISASPIWDLSNDDEQAIIHEFPDIKVYPHRNVNFINHEMNNSFINVLASKYFNGDYTAINLGRQGNGNRAAIKDLYFYPDIRWKDIKEKIVIFCPSGMERFDFINDVGTGINDHARWVSMWPNIFDKDGPVKDLWQSYRNSMFSEKFEIFEAIATVQELILWCEYNNATLIITPAFSTKYTKEYFLKGINSVVFRKLDRTLIHSVYNDKITPESLRTYDMWPWDNMFYPDDQLTFADLCAKQECKNDNELIPNVYSFIGTGSPNLWITPCSHPGVKGHDLFARYLHNYIEKKL